MSISCELHLGRVLKAAVDPIPVIVFKSFRSNDLKKRGEKEVALVRGRAGTTLLCAEF